MKWLLIDGFKLPVLKSFSPCMSHYSGIGHFFTGKSLSEALIFASTNPQYDDRLFIELPIQYMRIPSPEHVKNMLCTEIGFFKHSEQFMNQGMR